MELVLDPVWGKNLASEPRVLECLLRSALELGCWRYSDDLGVTVLGIAVGTELSSREWLCDGRKGA